MARALALAGAFLLGMIAAETGAAERDGLIRDRQPSAFATGAELVAARDGGRDMPGSVGPDPAPFAEAP